MKSIRFRKSAGFTLIELISCIVIVAVLASILYPTLASAKMSSKVAAAKLNLKNLHLAITLYRLDYEGVEYGDAPAMGLPDTAAPGCPLMAIIRKTSGPDYRHQSPCGFHPHSLNNTFHYYPSDPSDWKTWVEKLESRTMLFGDANCNTSNIDIENQFANKRCVGVALDGHIVTLWNDQAHYWAQEFFVRGNQ